MNKIALIASSLISIICVVAAIFFLYHDKEGWGWFLFVAVILFGTVCCEGGSSSEMEEED